jgi:hypothetical protein
MMKTQFVNLRLDQDAKNVSIPRLLIREFFPRRDPSRLRMRVRQDLDVILFEETNISSLISSLVSEHGLSFRGFWLIRQASLFRGRYRTCKKSVRLSSIDSPLLCEPSIFRILVWLKPSIIRTARDLRSGISARIRRGWSTFSISYIARHPRRHSFSLVKEFSQSRNLSRN